MKVLHKYTFDKLIIKYNTMNVTNFTILNLKRDLMKNIIIYNENKNVTNV